MKGEGDEEAQFLFFWAATSSTQECFKGHELIEKVRLLNFRIQGALEYEALAHRKGWSHI